MSISSEITRLGKNISDSLDAVAAKGVTVPTGSNSDDLPELIAAISGGVDGDNLGYGGALQLLVLGTGQLGTGRVL